MLQSTTTYYNIYYSMIALLCNDAKISTKNKIVKMIIYPQNIDKSSCFTNNKTKKSLKQSDMRLNFSLDAYSLAVKTVEVSLDL